MKSQRIKYFAAASMLAVMGFGAAPAFAQGLRADVPFKFRLGEQLLPAGRYSISQISTGANYVLLVRNWETRKSAMFIAGNYLKHSADKRPRMAFNCGDSGCILSEVWGATPGGMGTAVPQPRHRDLPERAALVYLQPAGTNR